MIRENLKMALRSIAGNKLRTFLTMLGVIIGVGAVVIINSIGEGVKGQVGSQVNELGANLIFVTPGQIISSKNGKSSGFNPSASIGNSTLTPADIATIQKTKGVKAVTSFSLISGILSQGGNQDTSALLLATTPSYRDVVESPKIDKGRFFGKAEESSNVVVLGADTRNTLFGKDAEAVDKTVQIRGQDFKVIGVLAGSSSGSPLGGPSQDDEAFIPTQAARALTDTDLSIFRIGIKATGADEVAPTVERVKAALHTNHGGQDDFSVLTQKDLLGAVDNILTLLTSAISAIASIALLVGGIGIMNMMLVSVTERTREIGLRKALGATSGMVLSQFLMEAVVLTMLGGLLGIGLAYAGGTAAGRLIKITPIFTMPVILTAFGISVAVGIIFGIAPAIKAARMRPIDALRYE